MLSDIMLSDIMLSAIMLSDIMLSAIRLNVIRLNVVALFLKFWFESRTLLSLIEEDIGETIRIKKTFFVNLKTF